MQKNFHRILKAQANYLEGMYADTRYPDFKCNAVLDLIQDLRDAASTLQDEFIEWPTKP